MAGWEGSQHDGAVFESAFDHGFEVSAGKYYLGDAGFGLTPFRLTPYRDIISVSGVKLMIGIAIF